MAHAGNAPLLRRALIALTSIALIAGVLVSAPAPVAATESSADLITTLEYTTPTSQFEDRKSTRLNSSHT